MRAFLLITHRASADGDFTLEDMPGSGGRVDIVVRCITSALLLSHGVRRDTVIYVLFQRGRNSPLLLEVRGAEVRYLRPDERSAGALIRHALIRGGEGLTSPGIYVWRRNLEETLSRLSEMGEITLLAEDGEDVETVDFPENVVFVLSDHLNLTEGEEEIVRKYAKKAVSVGPLSLHSDHVIAIIHNVLDRRQYS
jgi:tRNA (pseudouridine54-N1)-methyltransferase